MLRKVGEYCSAIHFIHDVSTSILLYAISTIVSTRFRMTLFSSHCQDKDRQNIHFDFSDFFHLESLNAEHEGLDIITTEEYLLREAMTGNIRDMSTGQVSFPPQNRTNWDGEDPKELKEWLR